MTEPLAPDLHRECAEYLYRALAAVGGIAIATNRAPHAVVALNAARRAEANPDLDTLAITRAPHSPDREVWIYKKPPPKAAATLDNLGLA